MSRNDSDDVYHDTGAPVLADAIQPLQQVVEVAVVIQPRQDR